MIRGTGHARQHIHTLPNNFLYPSDDCHRCAQHFYHFRYHSNDNTSIESCSNVYSDGYDHVLVSNIVNLVRFHRRTDNYSTSSFTTQVMTMLSYVYCSVAFNSAFDCIPTL